jgi:CheY-like chemotaxis protein
LAIVRGIVREHGGTVTVSTPPEGGVTFSLEFPAAALDESNTPVRTQAHGSRIVSRPVAAAPSLREWRGAHALVVEDEPTVARLIADVLEEEGLKVEVHTQAQPALARAAAEAFDLLICDMKLPGLSGRYVFESLAKARNPLTERLLFVTGDVLATATRDFLERHALPHLAKPFRVEELVEQARRVLAKAGERKSATAIARTNATGK